jgi:PAS domain S-box-containing protein
MPAAGWSVVRAGLLYCSSLDPLGASLIEGLEDAAVVTDRSLTVVAWNAVMEELTGTTRQAALGRPAAEMLAFLRDTDVASHLARALGGETSITGDVRYECPSRTREGWIAARYVPWRDGQGAIGGVIGLHTVVTSLRRRATFVRALESIGQSLTSSLDLNETLDTIVQRALEIMGADAALVVSWDGHANELTVLRAAGRLSEPYADAKSIPVGGGPMSRAILKGVTVTTPDVLHDPDTWLVPERRAQIEREGFRAVGAAPLRSKGRVHGALVVRYWTVRTFGDEDTATLQLLAEHAALAMDNARVYADATRRAERLRELTDLEQLVTESLVVDDVLRRIAQATARLLDAPIVQLWTADPAERVMRLSASSIEPGLSEVRMPRSVPFGEGVVGRVAETKTTIYVGDVTGDPRALSGEWARETGIVRMMSVPILAGNDDLLGVLVVRSRDESLSRDENRALVTSFAARAAIAMQHARMYGEAVHRAGRLRDLVAVSQSITGSLDSADVMRRITQAVAGMRPGALGAVHLYDATRGVLRAEAVSGAAEWEGLPVERPANAGLPGVVFEAQTPVLVPQPMTHPRTLGRAWWHKRPKGTYYGVPIAVGDTFVGVLDYVLPDGLPDAEEQEALRLLAAQAGIALRNAALYQTERVQAERIRALAAVNQRLSSALDLDQLLRSICESAATLIKVRFVAFWLADDAARTLTLASSSEPEIAGDAPRQSAPYDLGATGWVARHRDRLVIDDITTDHRIMDGEWLARWGLTSYAAYPVLAGDELLAILAFLNSAPIRVGDDAADVIDMFLGQASVAVRNAQLYREAQRRRDVAETLARVARELTGTLEVERIAELVTRGLVELLGTRAAAVYRYDGETGGVGQLAAYGTGADVVRGVDFRAGEGVPGWAIAERKIVVTPDVLREPRVRLSAELRERVVRHDIGAVVGVPLLTRDSIVGALALGDRRGREFSADELQALQAFADQTALALENARLYAAAQESLARLRETQAQLVQAAKMSALGQLVSGVAHELNNPLSVIIGYGQLLLARDVPATLKRPLELMVAQGDRMAKIVRNLLYFARQRPPERAAVDVRHVMEQTLALRMNHLMLSGITVEREFPDALPVINGDAQQLEQVFLNLLLNAEQAIHDAKAAGRIVLRARLRPDGRAILAQVVDDGPGIPPESLPRVFEPFYTTKIVGMGTGLGLSVSYGIVQEHGGRLTVDSRPGETTFTLELPVTEATPAIAAPRERRVFDGVGKTALVVEDEPSVLDLVVTLLGERGWRVDVAPGGRDGLESVRRQRYDLIVSDIRMPDGDGQEFYERALVHDPALRHRFIFITGDTAGDEARAFIDGAEVPVVEKPFSPLVFEDAVWRLMTAARP